MKETFPGNKPGWFAYGYNGNGQLTSRSEGNGSTTNRTFTYTFYNDGKPYEDRQGSTLLARRYYYNDGLLSEIESGGAPYCTYTYDGAHRLKTEYQSYVNKIVEHQYSTAPAHNETVYIKAVGGTILGRYYREYRSGGDLHYTVSPLGPAGTSEGPKTEFTYGPYGLLSEMTYDVRDPHDTRAHTTYQYDDGNLSGITNARKRLWLGKMTNYRGDDSIISSFLYDCDTVGNRTKITEANGDYTSYGYDNSYQLRSEARTASGGASVYSYDYQYDEAGNRTVKTLVNGLGTNTFTSSYVDNNLLESVMKGGTLACDPSYDSYGNQSTRVAGGETWSYTYDGLNHLTQVKRTSPTVYTIGSFTYDPLGRRIEKKTQNDTVIRRYIYDGDSVVAETDASNNIIAWYTPGICETRYDPALAQWKTLYYHDDGLGSTRQLTDNLQRVVDAYSYNAWGELMGSLRPASDPGKPENPYRFAGKSGYYSDDETGLQLLGARYYDPLLGRFITQDPSRDGLNWYAYGGNNPVNAVDPTWENWENGDLYWPLKKGKRPSLAKLSLLRQEMARAAIEDVPYPPGAAGNRRRFWRGHRRNLGNHWRRGAGQEQIKVPSPFPGSRRRLYGVRLRQGRAVAD